MKFMIVIKGPELAGPPPQPLIEAMDAYAKDAKEAGAFVEWGGLHPTSEGQRVRIKGGKLVVTDGPFTEAKELIGGFAIFNVASREEALDWARRFMALHIDHFPEWEGEVEIREMFEEPPAD